MKRSFLFLQGPRSPFFKNLSEQLLDNGHRVLKINFDSADRFFWHGENTADYKRELSEFGDYITDVARLRKITDLVMFDDSLPAHIAAGEALKNQKIRIHVYDKGYFGENWVTYEDRIFGNKTVLPRDPRFYLRTKGEDISRIKKFGGNERAKMLWALKYRLFGAKGDVKLPLFTRKAGFGNKTRAANYFLADFELSRKASFIRSFATRADAGDCLVFFHKGKIDANPAFKTRELASKYEVGERVRMVENANFKSLARGAKGYITNGSLDGLEALRGGTPVLALTQVVYNIQGLTSQDDVGEFWHNAQTPDAEIFAKFRNYVITRTQLNGSFYNRKGMKLLVAKSLRKILGSDFAAENSSEVFDVS